MSKSIKPKKGFGAIIDPRSDSEKEKDFLLAELVADLDPVNWGVKQQWRKFPIFDQNGSGSCVAQTVAKMGGVMYWLLNGAYVHFSATHVYQRRSNKPSGGMIGTNAGEIAKQSITLEELAPSQKMTDKQMDNFVIAPYKDEVGKVFKMGNYVQLYTGNIDAVASTIQKTGKPVMVWYYFDYPEWTTTPVLKNSYSAPNGAPCRHSVTAVDYTILDKTHTSDKSLWGKKALIIDDSWGTRYGEKGQRFITEDFHKARNFFAMYFTNFQFDNNGTPNPLPNPNPVPPAPNKPKYTFNTDLKYSATVVYGNKDIIALQNILKYEGLFPINTQSTGYFGSITKKAVVGFQTKYGIPERDGVVAGTTRAKLNQLYS